MAKKNKVEMVEINTRSIKYVDLRAFDELYIRNLVWFDSNVGDCWTYNQKNIRIIDKIIRDSKKNKYGNTVYRRTGIGSGD